MSEEEKLKARVNNLECAVHTLVAILVGLQPPDYAQTMNNMSAMHFDACLSLGSTIVEQGGVFIVGGEHD